MGAVYLATHLGTERYVALKLITPQLMSNEEFVERFKREARAAGRLRHPNVVDVTDFGFARAGADRVAYLVMEYLDGCTLGDVLAEEKRLPLDWVVDILEQVCSAVHEAHMQGIVHRDLKPDNIWLEPNRLGGYRIKVLDFGIAKLAAVGPGDEAQAASAQADTLIEPGQPLNISSGVSSSSGSLETDTLIFDEPARPAADNGEEMATLHFAPAASAPLDGVKAAAIAEVGDDGANTQLLTAAPSSDHQLTAAPAGRPTQVAGDVDKTLMFGETTGLDAKEKLTQVAAMQGTGLTKVGAIMGTPHYMSPEQCRSAHLDARSDIYSLGVIAYQMLTGDLPFTGSTSAVMSGHLENQPPAMYERNRKVNKRVSSVVMSALAKDPAGRPQSAAAFANSLRAQADGIGALYRRAFALYSEYFPKFLKLSVLAHIPVIITTLIMVGLTLAERVQPRAITPTKILLLICIVFFALLQVISYTVAASIISGVTAVIVTQLQAAPMRPVRLRMAFAVLKRRWKPFLKTVFYVTIRIIGGTILGIIPGIVITIRYGLYAPVVLLEGLQTKAALKRARALAARSWRTIILVFLLQFLIPIVVSSLVGRISFHRPSAAGTKVHMEQVYQQLSGLINIGIVPLMSIVSALLYLKMRQLGGETLGATLEQIEDVECDRTQWQQRMRMHLTMPTTHSTPHRSGSTSLK